jgi:hypothetical protein
MSYGIPPLTATGSILNVVGITSGVIVASAGASYAIRLVGGQASITRTSGAALVDVRIQTSVSGITIFLAEGLSIAGLPMSSIIIPEPGLSLPVNEDIVLWSNSSVASGRTECVIYYYMDTIT